MAPRVVLQVAFEELDRAASFYARAFGLIIGRRLGPGTVELLGAGAPLHLTAQQAEGGAGGPPVQVDLIVEDLESARERAGKAGAQLHGRIREYDWGSIAQLADPFGNQICLLQFHRRGLSEAPVTWVPGRLPLEAARSGAA